MIKGVKMSRSDKIELTDEQIELVEDMAGRGMTVPQMSGMLGISKKTFERRVKEDELLADALEKGRSKALYAITGHLYNKCAKGDTGAICFFLKCRAGWREQDVISREDAQKVFELAYNVSKPKEDE
jgi:predicted DNA-binding protein (UPF0251 family)